MSIFKNSKFSKATAFVASAGSLMPLLTKECSNSKVFAKGGAQKKLGFFGRILSEILSFIFNEENAKKAMDFLGLLAKEQDVKEEKDEEDRKEKEEGKKDENEEESKKEKNDKVDKEGKGENDQNYAPVPVPVKKEENDPSFAKYVLKFGQKLLKELLNFVYQDFGKKRVCRGSLLLVLDKRNLIKRDDEERYGNFVPDLSRRKVFEALGKIAILESEEVYFSEDEQKNIVVHNIEKNVGFTFDLDEEGNFLCVYNGNNSKKKFPFRIIAKNFNCWGIHLNEDLKSYYEGCSVFYALSFLDNKTLMECLLHKNFDVFEKNSFDGYRPTKMLEKLIEVFRKKDKTGKLLEKAEKSLRMFKFMERFSKGLECYGCDEYHEKLLKKIFDDNVLVEGEDKETLNEFRRLAVDYLAKLYRLYLKDNSKELDKMSEEVKKELGMDTEGFDFKNNSIGENLFSEN